MEECVMIWLPLIFLAIILKSSGASEISEEIKRTNKLLEDILNQIKIMKEIMKK